MPVPRHGRCAGASAARPSPGRSCFFQEAQAYADDNSLLFMETSAKTAMNVNDLFLAIGEAPGAAGGARLGSKGVCLGRSSPRPPRAFWEAEQSWCLSCPLVSAAPHGPAVAAPWAAVLLPGLSTKADAQCESGLRGNSLSPGEARGPCQCSWGGSRVSAVLKAGSCRVPRATAAVGLCCRASPRPAPATISPVFPLQPRSCQRASPRARAERRAGAEAWTCTSRASRTRASVVATKGRPPPAPA